MNDRFNSHLFWGSYSPLSLLTASALIILASSRLAFALICAGALVWVFGLTSLIFSAARKFLPENGKMIILLFLSAFMCGIFMIAAGLVNPLLIFGSAFFLLLIPPCFLSTGLFEADRNIEPEDALSRSLLEALVLSLIIVAFALIREPLGMGTLSFPGGSEGIIEIFGSKDDNSFVLARILSSSGGGLLLLGYGTALFRYFQAKSGEAQNYREEM